jgi:DUF4097 and DUF4098 domain-containing protein YvlB
MIRMFIAAAAIATLAAPVSAQDRSLADQQPPIQARPGGPEGTQRTDQTLDVTKGTRLVLTNNAGEVTVRSWDREQVRVQASHSERERVDIQTADMTLRVRGRATRGPANLIDYQVTVPRWMPVNLSGTYLEATIEGTAAEVTVETVHGNARVVGGSGAVTVRSVEGTITVDKASGKVQATTVNEGIRLTNVTGDMTAETTNGDIVIENAQTSSLEASTVNGDLTFNGTVRDGGAYRLTTHGGDIRVGLGGAANATIFVRTFQGDFAADFPIQLPEGQTPRSGSKRFNFTLGSGSARIELQSFNGDIVLARKAIVSREEARRIRREQSQQPPQPPQPPQPAKAPKPPKDLALNVASSVAPLVHAAAEAFSREFTASFTDEFEHEFEQQIEDAIVEPDIDLDFDFDFDFEPDLDLDELLEIETVPAPAPAPPAPRPRR